LIDPSAKVLAPLAQRLPPFVGHGHHLAGAVHIAAGVQPVAHKLGQCLEVVAVLLFVVGVVQNHAVVLVGLGRLLVAPLRTGGHPGVVNGRWPQLEFTQLQQARCQRIGDGRHDMPGAVSTGLGSGQTALQLFDASAGLDQPLYRCLLVNGPRQIHRRVALLFGQIGVGDHAGHGIAIHDWHMMDVVPCHHQQGVKRVALDVDREWGQGRDVHDGLCRVQPGGHHPVAQVAVCHQAKQRAVLNNQDRRDPLVAHAPGRVHDRRMRRQRDGRTLHQATYRCRDEVHVVVGRSGRWLVVHGNNRSGKSVRIVATGAVHAFALCQCLRCGA